MNKAETRILVASLIEVQELVNLLIMDGQDNAAFDLLEEQQMKVERLEKRAYYTRPDSPRTSTPDGRDG